jgi:glutamate carboxypeptidase
MLAACEADLPWLLDVIESLVRHESPSTDKAAVDRCGAAAARLLVDLGSVVTRVGQERAGDHIRAEFGAGPEQFLVLGHLDTVWPVGQLERMPLRVDKGRLYGPGVYDMKAGIGLVMLAMRALGRLGLAPPRRIVVLLTSDEETGSAAGRPVVEAEADRSAAVLVVEPPLPGGGLKTSRKGVGMFRIEARGVAAHAGIDPARGASAIREIAHQILHLDDLQDPAAGLTLNAGVVAGGTRANVVAEHAHVEVDVRVSTMADARRISEGMAQLRPHVPGVSIAVTGGINRPPMERTTAVSVLYARARALAADMGRDVEEGGTGGASDGNFTAARGVPTLDGLGAIGDGAHALDEHIVVDALAWRAALLAGLMLG